MNADQNNLEIPIVVDQPNPVGVIQPETRRPIIWYRILVQCVFIASFVLAYWTFVWQTTDGWPKVALLVVGMLGGCGLVVADELWLAKQYTEPGETVRPLTKSIVFVLALIPAGIFVLTSTASVLALGFVLGLLSTLVFELLLLFRTPSRIRQQFLWQLQRNMGDQEVQQLVLALVVFVVLVVVLALW